MSDLGVALIGTGFMDKAHALAYHSLRAVMGEMPNLQRALLVDQPLQKAQMISEQFGFDAASDDWRQVLADPKIDIVSITTPAGMHREMAIAAMQAGKHVWCEKPMALTLTDAEEMAAAARGARGNLQSNTAAGDADT